MKKYIGFFIALVLFAGVNAQPLKSPQEQSQPNRKGVFGEGLYQVSYINVYGCKTEFQSFDSSVTQQKLDRLLSYMYRIGSKDRGFENEYKTYFSYDYTKQSDTKKKLAEFAKKQVKDFEKAVAKLEVSVVPKEFAPMKAELLANHKKRLEFEQIFKEWFVNGDDTIFRKRILAYYNGMYMEATLDKTLALKDQMDKFRYTYAEIYDIVLPSVFSYDKFIEIQNKLMFDYKIEIVVDPSCTKS